MIAKNCMILIDFTQNLQTLVCIRIHTKQINFNKIKNNKKYKEGKIHSDKSKLEDIPYYAFSISSKEDLKNKLIILIEEIFKEY